ncbi:MAG: 6-carboxytetrahydropterin synthase QueD [Spirochaetaceae bacterium]|nr:6-carboxytetrahydropterin synthase QueD [Spirochaetaceae bacterium]
MFEVRVEADFAAAHFLKDYNGKCENLHGHNYQVFAHARGKELGEGGMLLDFGKLKQALRKVCKTLDHSNLNDKEIFQQNPSAERIALYIFTEIKKELEIMFQQDNFASVDYSQFLYAVDVFETPTSRARYSID